MLRKNKKAYFEKLSIKEIGGNKTFRKTVWPYFNDKDNKSSKITLVENNFVIADEERVNEQIFYKHCKKFKFKSSGN